MINAHNYEIGTITKFNLYLKKLKVRNWYDEWKKKLRGPMGEQSHGMKEAWTSESLYGELPYKLLLLNGHKGKKYIFIVLSL